MKTTLATLRKLIKEAVIINEFGTPRGKLRRVRGSGGRQHRIGKIEDENRPMSFSEAEMMFPGSTDAWAEIVPYYFPDFPFADDPFVVKKRSQFFKEGDTMTVAAQDMPQITLGTWDPVKNDWILMGDMQELP